MCELRELIQSSFLQIIFPASHNRRNLQLVMALSSLLGSHRGGGDVVGRCEEVHNLPPVNADGTVKSREHQSVSQVDRQSCRSGHQIYAQCLLLDCDVLLIGQVGG
jgi:hypothetical protein